MKKHETRKWNKKLKVRSWKNLLIIMGIMSILLAGCGSTNSKTEDSAPSTATSEVADSSAGFEESADVAQADVTSEMTTESKAESATATDSATASDSVETQDTNRKLIKNANMSVETKMFESFLNTLNKEIAELGGYTQSSDVQGNSYNSNSYRYATVVARIPNDKLDGFLSLIAEESNVINKIVTVEDITLQYVDMESHKKALVVEQDRLLALLEKAEKLEDIIAIENRLSEVRYQIESYESQLRTYDNQIDYSTVTVQITEVEKETPVKEQTIFERIKTGFLDNASNVGVGLKNLFVWFMVNIPYFVILAIIVIVVIMIIKKRAKKSDKKIQKQSQQESIEEVKREK